MLNKIMMLMFVAAVSAASTTVLAASSFSDGPVRIADSSLAILNSATNEDVHIQAASVGSDEVRGIVSQETDSSEMTLPATGWLLAMALVGFVMLSNRRSV